MKSRKLIASAGALSIIPSLLSIIVYGIYFVIMGLYILFIFIFLLPFGESAASTDLFGVFGLLGGIFLIPTAIGITGIVFAARMFGIAKMEDYYYKRQKARLICYIVFLFIFAGIMTGYGAFMVASGTITPSSGSDIASLLASFPFGLVIGPMFLTSAILLLIDVCRNRKVFRADIPAPKTEISTAFQQPVQQQPQIITLKPGEELPEHLKGRVVPVPPVKAESEEEVLKRDLSALKEMLDNQMITKTEYDKLKKKRLEQK